MTTLKNDTLTEIEGTFIMVGTDEIKAWTPAEAFIVSLQTEEDFDRNGVDYEEYQDMKVGEIRTDFDYEGMMIIRVK